ncbi:GNAT family N-acetyltransferase [Bosea sp. 2KB_26]|uniref:GNAT family N-acetyltransferase n=1 Tax=Bosea sp. 2KB_26 TaxID=3237475 RepID=UPI003F90AD89
MTAPRARIVERIAEITPEAWDRCCPGEAENHAYYSACEQALAGSGSSIAMGAACVEDAFGISAIAPFFLFNYRLDTPFQGGLRRFGDAVFRLAPRLVSLKVLCVGSPYAERCHASVRNGLGSEQSASAFAALGDILDQHARSVGADLVAWKDVAEQGAPGLRDALLSRGFARVGSLPFAVLDLPFVGEADYLASLSAATRKDVRRKLAKAGAVRVEMRHGLEGIESEITELYESTRAESGLDYGDLEVLPPDYFKAVSAALGERAIFALYWVGQTLAAFNLLLIENDRVIDKFLGMRYPLARQHNLYAVSWMTNVRFCLERGIVRLQTGQTAYASKLRFGSRLVPSTVFFRHRNAALQWALKSASPWFAFDRFDPDLRALRRTPAREQAAREQAA